MHQASIDAFCKPPPGQLYFGAEQSLAVSKGTVVDVPRVLLQDKIFSSNLPIRRKHSVVALCTAMKAHDLAVTRLRACFSKLAFDYPACMHSACHWFPDGLSVKMVQMPNPPNTLLFNMPRLMQCDDCGQLVDWEHPPVQDRCDAGYHPPVERN